jgi:hypothetical protein
MHIHRLVVTRPLYRHIVVFAQPSHIVAELLPAMALEAGGDEKVALTHRSPQALGAVPTIE